MRNQFSLFCHCKLCALRFMFTEYSNIVLFLASRRNKNGRTILHHYYTPRKSPTLICKNNKRVKQSRYRPGVAQRVPES
jgi:hypothetical protein